MDFAAVVVECVIVCLWVWGLGSWCMCAYVLFASCEGVRWFNLRKNPLLIVGACGSAAALAASFPIPCTSVFVTALGWTSYAALVTSQHSRFPQWSRHILPVNAPTLALLALFASSC